MGLLKKLHRMAYSRFKLYRLHNRRRLLYARRNNRCVYFVAQPTQLAPDLIAKLYGTWHQRMRLFVVLLSQPTFQNVVKLRGRKYQRPCQYTSAVANWWCHSIFIFVKATALDVRKSPKLHTGSKSGQKCVSYRVSPWDMFYRLCFLKSMTDKTVHHSPRISQSFITL